MRFELNLENLKELDGGKVQVAFGLELKKCLMDCLNRPNEKKSRKVSLECYVTPIAADRDCEGVTVAFDVRSSVPARKTEGYKLGITTQGQAYFVEETAEEAESSR